MRPALHPTRPDRRSHLAFALVGGIAAALGACQGHDAAGRVEVSDQDCVTCHLNDYEQTVAPRHEGLFETTCAECHGTTHWVPAVVDHVWWPLENRHTEIACSDCHTVGYAPGDTPTACVGCHLADFERSPYPGHDQFGTECQRCHTTAGWIPASGGHPEAAFPIQRGDHRRVECLDCHDPALGSYADGFNTDCVGCHTGEHERSRMDDKHRDVRSYPGDASRPNFCLRCHPDGVNRDD